MKAEIPVSEIPESQISDLTRLKDDSVRRKAERSIMDKTVIVGELGLPIEDEKRLSASDREFFRNNPEMAEAIKEERLSAEEVADELERLEERESLESELAARGVEVGRDPNLVTKSYDEMMKRKRGWRRVFGWLAKMFR